MESEHPERHDGDLMDLLNDPSPDSNNADDHHMIKRRIVMII